MIIMIKIKIIVIITMDKKEGGGILRRLWKRCGLFKGGGGGGGKYSMTKTK